MSLKDYLNNIQWILNHRFNHNNILHILIFLLICSSSVASPHVADTSYVFSYKTSSASFSKDTLKLTTGKVKRTLLWTGSGFKTLSFLDIENKFEWSDLNSNPNIDWEIPLKKTEYLTATIKEVIFSQSDDNGFTADHLAVSILISYGDVLEMKYISKLFPNAAGIWTNLEVRKTKSDLELSYTVDSTFFEYYGSTQLKKSAKADHIPIDFSKPNERFYWGYRNDPGHTVNTFSMIKEEKFSGFPLFQPEWIDWASGVIVSKDSFAIAVIKESPKTSNNSGHETGQFVSSKAGLEVTGWGLRPNEITNEFKGTWPTWIVVSANDEPQLQLAIKSFDRLVFPVLLERDAVTIIDTWGSDYRESEPSTFFGRENAHFDIVSKELITASNLGIDIVRIDDGWQNGRTFTENNWFPNPNMGYKPDWNNLRNMADSLDVGVGLWANIRKITKEELFKIQKDLNPVSWKFDFDIIKDHQSFADRMMLAEELVLFSEFKTQIGWCPEYNDSRYGWYSKARKYGPMFFQNIQNNFPIHVIYVPYISLKHHWNFSKYYNLNKLQCNIQNPALTNKEFSDAHLHDISYSTAISLAGAPVFFMLTQLLTESQQKEVKDILEVYNPHKNEFFDSFVFPIGNEPDNKSWTGFQIHNPKTDSGYLLVFRELHNLDTHQELNLYFMKDKKYQLTDLISKEAVANVQVSNSKIKIGLFKPASFKLMKYKTMSLD
jgi:hypothetical protein